MELEREGDVAVVTLRRPDVFNAINQELIAELRSVLADSAADASVRALVLTGAGKAFCSGADLAADDGGEPDWSVGRRVAHSMEVGFNPLVRDLAGFPKPVIAAVNGVAAGGGVGLALSADIVLAARSASFIQVFGPRLAIVPDMGCSWFLPHYLGRARARGLALTGDRLSAEVAEQWGLIWKCVADEALMEESMALADRLAKGPTRAFGAIKEALDLAPSNSLSEHLDYERDRQRELADSPEFSEGVRAFLQKREPRFVGG